MKKPRTLVRLWGETWQRWDIPGDPGAVVSLQAATKTRKPSPVILALPSRFVVCVPLWINSIDEAVIRSSMALELELRGLTAGGHGIVGAFESEGRTLAVAAVYPATFPEAWKTWTARWYEASALTVELPEEAISLWIEGEDLVAVVSREGRPIFWTTMDFPTEAGQFRTWLEELRLGLQAQGLWRAVYSSIVVSAEVRHRLGLDDIAVSNFVPSLTHASLDWKPVEIRDQESREASSSHLRLVANAVLTVLLLALVAAGLHLWFLQNEVRTLTTEIRAMEQEASAFQPILQEWQQVGPSVETAVFPLETLLAVVSNLPEKGIRITSYDLDDDVVAVDGEAGSVRLASEFSAAISGDQNLASREWVMPSPSLLPDNSARFRIEGRTR